MKIEIKISTPKTEQGVYIVVNEQDSFADIFEQIYAHLRQIGLRSWLDEKITVQKWRVL